MDMKRSYVVLAVALAATFATLYFLSDLSTMMLAVAFVVGIGFAGLTWFFTRGTARTQRTSATSGARRRSADGGAAWAGGAAASVDCSSGASGFGGDCGAGAV